MLFEPRTRHIALDDLVPCMPDGMKTDMKVSEVRHTYKTDPTRRIFVYAGSM